MKIGYMNCVARERQEGVSEVGEKLESVLESVRPEKINKDNNNNNKKRSAMLNVELDVKKILGSP